jgi:hypothetical protein
VQALSTVEKARSQHARTAAQSAGTFASACAAPVTTMCTFASHIPMFFRPPTAHHFPVVKLRQGVVLNESGRALQERIKRRERTIKWREQKKLRKLSS